MGSLQEGTRVGDSRLRRKRSELVRDSLIMVPLASASVHVVCEYQAGLWGLKSPIMMLLSQKLKPISFYPEEHLFSLLRSGKTGLSMSREINVGDRKWGLAVSL